MIMVQVNYKVHKLQPPSNESYCGHLLGSRYQEIPFFVVNANSYHKDLLVTYLRAIYLGFIHQ